jgi:predicted membrane-bound mannosyltransferase
MLLPIYEFLPLFFAFLGAIYYTIKGNLFSRFLVYWTVLALIIYSYAGEKMPWLSLHIALPVILLGGMFIGQLLQEALNLKGARAWVIRGVTVLVLLLLLPFSIHVAFQENYQKSDEPPQMLFYAGISSDVPPIMAEIDKLAQKTGEGKQLAITIDGKLFYDGPAWYLRDYKNIDFSISQPKGSVLIIHTSSENDVDKSYLEKYGEGQKFHHLIWFPEEYRDFDLGWWWGYFFHRETRGPYWSQEGIVYFLSNSEF